MDNLTIIIPFWNGHQHIHKILADIPTDIPVVIVDDHSDELLIVHRANTVVLRPETKRYFTGAVNYALEHTATDVLVLNQDVRLEGTEWLDILDKTRGEYALIGERIKGNHPAFPNGYVHGTFQFMRRDAIEKAGLMDAENYPLWGASALWQWQICRKGFKSLPLPSIPGMRHWHTEASRNKPRYGDSIVTLLQREPQNRDLLIRTPPLVSVIIPCYNYGRYLPDAMASLFGGESSLGLMDGQTFQSFEVLIVDDGSTDDTPAIAERYLDGWNGVRYIRRINGGTSAANNTGIEAALGKYISILSADDMREAWSLNDLVQAAIKNPHHIIYDELTEFGHGSRRKRWPLANYDFEVLLERNMVHAGILFERKAWEEVGGYPEVMKYGREDWAFNVAMGEKGYCGIKIERSGYLYRREQQNRTLTNVDGKWRQRFQIQMAQLFPHLYRGERTMACCGKGGSRSSSPTGVRSMSRNLIPSGVNMVLLEYHGGSVGSVNWGGQGSVPSGRYYRFGANPKDKLKYVEERALPCVVKQREHGKDLFSRYAIPEPVKAAVKATSGIDTATPKTADPQPVKMDTPVPIDEDLTVKVQRVECPDPGEHTVSEIFRLRLSAEQWQCLREKEIAGKNRLSVLRFSEEHSATVPA